MGDDFELDFDDSLEDLDSMFNDSSDDFDDQSSGSSFQSSGAVLNGGQSIDDESSDIIKSNPGNLKAVRKTAVFSIVVGIVLIIAVFGIVGLIRGIDNKDNNSSSISTGNYTLTSERTQVSNQSNIPVEQSQSNISVGQSSQSDWILFNSDTGNLSFNDELIPAIFSVTSIKHYVKQVDSNNIELKTVITGALSGFTGAYEIELPYSKGSRINNGLTFDVQVRIGTYAGNQTIVDEIIYWRFFKINL